MKNLKDAILEKLKVDDIVFNEFPIDSELDDMIEFLKDKGFKLLKNNDESISNLFNKCHERCIRNINNSLWFADTSKKRISKDNPVFYIKCNSEDVKDNILKVYSIEDVTIDIIVENDKKEFLEELNKRFDW